MIERVRMRNFKCFDDVSIPLGRLTVLAGLNGSGKSSVIQSLLLLRQSGLNRAGEPAGLRLQGALVDLGSFSDVLYEDAPEDTVTLEIWFECGESVMVEVGRSAAREPHLRTWMGFDDAHDSPLYRRDMYYLGAERLGPRKTLPLLDQPESGTPLGTQGEHVLWFLERFGNRMVGDQVRFVDAKKDTLAAQTTAWLGVVSPGVELGVDPVPNADMALASYAFSQENSPPTRAFRATNVGFGLSYALPMIVAFLSAEQDDLVIIENPEAHLHPGGQTKLAELAATAAAAGAQVILETHSDHILDGIRLAVRNTVIGPEQSLVSISMAPC